MFLIRQNLIYITAFLFFLENILYIILSRVVYEHCLKGNDHLHWQTYRVYRKAHIRIFSSRKFDRFRRLHNGLTIFFYLVIISTFMLFIMGM